MRSLPVDVFLAAGAGSAVEVAFFFFFFFFVLFTFVMYSCIGMKILACHKLGPTSGPMRSQSDDACYCAFVALAIPITYVVPCFAINVQVKPK